MTLPSISPTRDAVLASLRSFLLTVLPAGTEVVKGQDNRVAGPVGPDYVIMTPTMMTRLETNVDLYADAAFVGSASGATLTVSQMLHGSVQPGSTLFGVGIPPGISVASQTSGSVGGTGVYALSGTVGVIGSETMACGVLFATQPTEIDVQLDVYGPNSADNAQIITTLFRDDFAVQAFGPSQPTPPGWRDVPPGGTVSNIYVGVAPLFADDPRQMTQVFGELQFEQRWVIDARMQANQIVTAPQQFAGAVRVVPFPVDLLLPG